MPRARDRTGPLLRGSRVGHCRESSAMSAIRSSTTTCHIRGLRGVDHAAIPGCKGYGRVQRIRRVPLQHLQAGWAGVGVWADGCGVPPRSGAPRVSSATGPPKKAKSRPPHSRHPTPPAPWLPGRAPTPRPSPQAAVPARHRAVGGRVQGEPAAIKVAIKRNQGGNQAQSRWQSRWARPR
eukprot:7377531-Prymnesium_polylepis.1